MIITANLYKILRPGNVKKYKLWSANVIAFDEKLMAAKRTSMLM